MKSIERTCLRCDETFTQIPLLRCGHFYCHECYSKLKAVRPNPVNNNKCPCPICGENMIRKCRI